MEAQSVILRDEMVEIEIGICDTVKVQVGGLAMR